MALGGRIKEILRAIRAARSYEYNRVLRPKVEARLERAQSRLKSYLMLSGATSARLGGYQVELIDGELVVNELPPDGWEQLEMERHSPGEAHERASPDTGQ